MMTPAKATKKKNGLKGLAKYKADNSGVTGDELKAAALTGCQNDLVKLYRKNKKDLDRMVEIQNELVSLKKKVKQVSTAEDKTIQSWLKDFPELIPLVKAGTARDELQRRASQAAAAGGGGGRTTWDAKALVAALQGVEASADANGLVAFDKAMRERFSAPSVDILTKRFKCVNGDVVVVRKDKPEANATLEDGYKVKKQSGERAGYKFNVKNILERLKKEIS